MEDLKMLKQYGLNSKTLKQKMNEISNDVETIKDSAHVVIIKCKDGSQGSYNHEELRSLLNNYGLLK
jgi:acetamidase/formamidase